MLFCCFFYIIVHVLVKVYVKDLGQKSLSLSKSMSGHLQSMSLSGGSPGCQQKLVAVKLPLVADDGHVREVVACERVPHIT